MDLETGAAVLNMYMWMEVNMMMEVMMEDKRMISITTTIMMIIPKMEIIGRIMKPVRRLDLLLMSDMWMMMTDTRMVIVMTSSMMKMEIIGWIMQLNYQLMLLLSDMWVRVKMTMEVMIKDTRIAMLMIMMLDRPDIWLLSSM